MALIVLLRGINVGGHRAFRPTILAQELRAYDVVSIGAAGTFVVRKPVSQTKLRDELRRHLPFAAEIMICTGESILQLAATDPFAGEPADRSVMQFVSVRAAQPRAIERVAARIHVGRRCVQRGQCLRQRADAFLGHQRQGIVRVYQRHRFIPEMTAAFEAWANHLARLRNPEGPANVLRLRSGSV